MTEVDRLTKEAQQALRRTMEKYMTTCRIILCANSIAQVIPAIRSRCLAVRVPAPTHEDICTILKVNILISVYFLYNNLLFWLKLSLR